MHCLLRAGPWTRCCQSSVYSAGESTDLTNLRLCIKRAELAHSFMDCLRLLHCWRMICVFAGEVPEHVLKKTLIVSFCSGL